MTPSHVELKTKRLPVYVSPSWIVGKLMDSGVGASSAAGRAKFHLPSARLLFPLRKEPSEVGGHDRPFQLLHPQDFAKSPKKCDENPRVQSNQ